MRTSVFCAFLEGKAAFLMDRPERKCSLGRNSSSAPTELFDLLAQCFPVDAKYLGGAGNIVLVGSKYIHDVLAFHILKFAIEVLACTGGKSKCLGEIRCVNGVIVGHDDKPVDKVL